MAMSGRCTRAGVAGAIGLVAIFGVSGCDALADNLHTVFKRGSEAIINIAPGANDKGEAPAYSPITVSVSQGSLTEVIVTGPKGKQLVGSMNADSTTWTSNVSSLDFSTKYSVQAKAVDASGQPTETSTTLHTLTPKNTISGYFGYIDSGSSVGVGMPIKLEFSQPVKNTKAVEDQLFVSSSKPTTGAWSWSSDKQSVTFRPQTFWPAKSKIAVRAALKGIQTSPGVYGEEDLDFSMNTGSSLIATVDADTQEMKVVQNGKLIRTVPITTGKAGFETRSGIQPIMAKEGTVIMDAASGGTPKNSPDYYRLTVHHAMRITESGEYLHAAPWSVGSQGSRASSHGCVGMSDSNAAWLESIAQVGDVVIIKNTGRQWEAGNGITEWNVPWKTWLKSSKDGEQQVGPGSITSTTA